MTRALAATLLLAGCFAPEAPVDKGRQRSMAEVSVAGTIAHPSRARVRLWLANAPCNSPSARGIASIDVTGDRFALDGFVPAGARAWLCSDAPTTQPLPSLAAPITKSDFALELR